LLLAANGGIALKSMPPLPRKGIKIRRTKSKSNEPSTAEPER
jgi:hypothetical protein